MKFTYDVEIISFYPIQEMFMYLFTNVTSRHRIEIVRIFQKERQCTKTVFKYSSTIQWQLNEYWKFGCRETPNIIFEKTKNSNTFRKSFRIYKVRNFNDSYTYNGEINIKSDSSFQKSYNYLMSRLLQT